MINYKGWGGYRQGNTSRYYPGTWLQKLRKTTKPSVRIFVVPARSSNHANPK
jgi:hypothetical protein